MTNSLSNIKGKKTSKEEGLFNKNRSILIFGISISQFGSMLFRMALGFWVLIETGSALKSAGIVTAGVVSNLIFTPLASNIIGHLNKKKIIIRTDIIMGILWTSLWLIFRQLDTFDEKFLLMLVGTFVTTSFAGINNLASQSLLRILTPDRLLHKLYAFLGFFDNFRMLGITALAGVAYTMLGIETIILINAISFGAAVLIELLIRSPEIIKKVKLSWNPFAHYKGFLVGSKVVTKDVNIRNLFILTMGMMFVSVPMFQISNRFYMIETLGIEPELYSFIMAFGTIFTFVGPFLTGILSRGKLFKLSRYAAVFFVFPAIGMIAVSSLLHEGEYVNGFQAMIIWIASFYVMRSAWSITAISRHSSMNMIIPVKDVGRMKGMIQFYWEFLGLILIPLAGLVIDNWGIEYMNSISACAMFIVAIMYWKNSTLKKLTKIKKIEDLRNDIPLIK